MSSECSRSESASDSVRYFVAVPLPHDVERLLAAMQPKNLDGARLAASDSFHLTLHFLGPLTSEQKLDVVATLERIAFTRFLMTIRGTDVFRRHGAAFVLWAGVEECPALHALQRQVGTVLERAIGFQPENRPYSPHITLARLKETVSEQALAVELQRNAVTEIPEITISRFALFSSRNENGVPRYRVEAAFPHVHPDLTDS